MLSYTESKLLRTYHNSLLKKGDKGGFVEKIEQIKDNAWVYGNAQVYGDAWVSGDALIDSIDAIIVICIAMRFSITVTRKYLFIGCKTIKRSEVKNITKEKAVELGLPEEYYDAYKLMIKGAMKLVKGKAETK